MVLCWLAVSPAPADLPSGTAPSTRRAPGFCLGFVPEAGVALDTRAVEPGGSETLAVRLTRIDGSTSPVALSLTGLPPGVVARHPTSLAPSLPATISLAAEPWMPEASYPFGIVATEAGQAVVLPATLVVGDLPNLTSLVPDTIPAGRTTIVTLRGRDLEHAEVRAATARPLSEAPDRALPRVSVLSADARGTKVTVAVDATAPGVAGYYDLLVINQDGRAAAALRVVTESPAADPAPPWPGWEPQGLDPASQFPGGELVEVPASPSTPPCVRDFDA